MNFEDLIKLTNELHHVYQESLAWKQISERSREAHMYCQKNKAGILGENVWHIILDDAIRLRAENERLKREHNGNLNP